MFDAGQFLPQTENKFNCSRQGRIKTKLGLMLQPRKGPIFLSMVYRHYRDVCSFDTHQSPQTKNGLACKYKNKIWLQFLFIVIAAILKQQISKFYPQIQRTEASDHIYFSQQPVINVKAIFFA